MSTKKIVWIWFSMSALFISFSSAAWNLFFRDIAESIAYRVPAGKYVFPFGTTSWFDGLFVGIIWSLVFALLLIRNKDEFEDWRYIFDCKWKSYMWVVVVYTLVMAFFALPALFTTDPVEPSMFMLFTPFMVFGHCFISIFFFIFPIAYIHRVVGDLVE